MTATTNRSLAPSGLIAGLVLLAGAGAYALALGPGGVTFDVTPLAVGLVVVVAGLASRSDRLVVIALPLIGWGAAVLATRHGPVPDDREAPAFLMGAGLGLVAATLLARRVGASTTGAAAAVVSGGAAFYLAFDVEAVSRWPLWAGALVVWAGWEALVEPRLAARSHHPGEPAGEGG